MNEFKLLITLVASEDVGGPALNSHIVTYYEINDADRAYDKLQSEFDNKRMCPKGTCGRKEVYKLY